MEFLTNRIKWLMIASGVFTSAMLLAFLAPATALETFFGVTSMSAHEEIVVRNWGFLIFTVGALLIYGAFNPPNRNLVLMIATITKCVFVGLVLTYGSDYMGAMGVPVVVDSIIIVIFSLYLILQRGLGNETNGSDS